MEMIFIPRRFSGVAPEWGNGGYTCGVVAQLLGGGAEVTLRRPVPTERELTAERSEDGVSITDGDATLVEAFSAEVEQDAPEPPPVEEAQAAALKPEDLPNPGFGCFVCGPGREPGDGLRLFPGPLPGRKLVATTWTPHGSLSTTSKVPPEIVWAALDCPSAFAFLLTSDPPAGPCLLGRLSAKLLASVHVAHTLIVVAWPKARDGRKIYAASALYEPSGELVAVASATWITLSSGAFN